jgi:hypothetical protein
MYRWRALTFNARHYYPQIGVLYTPEELGALDVNEDGAVVTEMFDMTTLREAATDAHIAFAPGRFRPPTDEELANDALLKKRDVKAIEQAFESVKSEYDKIGGGPFEYIEQTYVFFTKPTGEKVRTNSGLRKVTITAERWRNDNLSLWLMSNKDREALNG